jgi:hypothetical protein
VLVHRAWHVCGRMRRHSLDQALVRSGKPECGPIRHATMTTSSQHAGDGLCDGPRPTALGGGASPARWEFLHDMFNLLGRPYRCDMLKSPSGACLAVLHSALFVQAASQSTLTVMMWPAKL